MDSTTLRDEIAALATVSEDQFEANLTTVLADFDSFVAAQPAPASTPRVATSIAYSDGSTQPIPQS